MTLEKWKKDNDFDSIEWGNDYIGTVVKCLVKSAYDAGEVAGRNFKSDKTTELLELLSSFETDHYNRQIGGDEEL